MLDEIVIHYSVKKYLDKIKSVDSIYGMSKTVREMELVNKINGKKTLIIDDTLRSFDVIKQLELRIF